jgi:hypothetical protein
MDLIKNDLIKDAYTLGFSSWFGMSIIENNYHLYLSDLQKWLREEYGFEFHIYRIERLVTGERYGVECERWANNIMPESLFNDYKKTYESALEFGLIEALKLIKK